MRQALEAAGHVSDEIDAVMERLRQERLLDDQALARRFARARVLHFGQGQRRIRQRLQARGIESALAERGLHEALEDVSEAVALERAARRYWERQTRESPRRRMHKLWGFLLRRGFPPELVRERLSVLWPRWWDALQDQEIQVDDDTTGDLGAHESA